MAFPRDPASVLLDGAARKLLARAYANPGTWQGTRLADPDLRVARWLAARDIYARDRDNASAAAGRGLDAKDRWGRAFARALYYQHKWHSPAPGHTGWRGERRTVAREAGALRIEFGRRVVPRGIIPAGRAVRVMYAPGGRRALAAVRRLPDRDRIYDDAGDTAARWADPALRDW